jgi:hypothetical protein
VAFHKGRSAERLFSVSDTVVGLFANYLARWMHMRRKKTEQARDPRWRGSHAAQEVNAVFALAAEDFGFRRADKSPRTTSALVRAIGERMANEESIS